MVAFLVRARLARAHAQAAIGQLVLQPNLGVVVQPWCLPTAARAPENRPPLSTVPAWASDWVTMFMQYWPALSPG